MRMLIMTGPTWYKVSNRGFGISRRMALVCGLWLVLLVGVLFFFSSRRRHTRFDCDWSSDVCSSDLVGVRVRAARDGDHRREFGIRDRSEGAGHPGKEDRHDDRRAGAHMARVPRDRGPDGGEDPRPDDRADAERGELEGAQRALEPTADLAVGDALVDGLATEELCARQRAAPAPA